LSYITSLLTFLSCFLTILSVVQCPAMTRHFGRYNRYYI